MKYPKITRWGSQTFGFSIIFSLWKTFFWNILKSRFSTLPTQRSGGGKTSIWRKLCYYFFSIRGPCSFRNPTTCFVNARNAWVSIIVSNLYFFYYIFWFFDRKLFWLYYFNWWYYYEPIIFYCYEFIIYKVP